MNTKQVYTYRGVWGSDNVATQPTQRMHTWAPFPLISIFIVIAAVIYVKYKRLLPLITIVIVIAAGEFVAGRTTTTRHCR